MPKKQTEKQKQSPYRTAGKIKMWAWNIRGLCNTETELERASKARNVDLAITSEMKKKLGLLKN
jgi:hypothetical protein